MLVFHWSFHDKEVLKIVSDNGILVHISDTVDYISLQCSTIRYRHEYPVFAKKCINISHHTNLTSSPPLPFSSHFLAKATSFQKHLFLGNSFPFWRPLPLAFSNSNCLLSGAKCIIKLLTDGPAWSLSIHWTTWNVPHFFSPAVIKFTINLSRW